MWRSPLPAGYINAEIPRNHSFKCIGTDYYQVTLTDASGNLIWTRPYMFTTRPET